MDLIIRKETQEDYNLGKENTGNHAKMKEISKRSKAYKKNKQDNL